MQISNVFSRGTLPPPQGGGSSPGQWQALRERQERILQWRTIQFWWYPIALVLFGAILAAYLGQSALDYPKETFGGIAGVLLFFWAVRRLEFGLVVLAVAATPFVPTALKTDWFYVSPVVPLLMLLLFVSLLHIAFHNKQPLVLPSIRTIWPLLGLFALACISEAFSHTYWEPDVAKSVLGNPIQVDEGVGLFVYAVPLMMVFVSCVALTKKSKWSRYVLLGLLGAAVIDALVIIVKYKSLGADVYTFRYTSPSIGWMPLESLAQLLGLGCIIGYAHTLGAPNWRQRIVYALPTGLCLLAIYFSLENSWWTEVAVALLVMTIVYSRKLLLCYAVGGIGLIPFLPTFLQKLQQKGQVDALRLVIWQDMLRVWHKRPLLGVGPGNVWAYDQVSTHLPSGLRNINQSGLGVAHEGYIQTLTELGPLGLLCQISFLAIMLLAAWRLYRYAKAEGKISEKILGLAGLGLVCGAAAGDLTSSYFFLPPRQALHVVNLPMAMMHWAVYGCVLYHDKIRRLALKGLKIEDQGKLSGE
jgi:O-antigen ligase